MSDIPKVSAPRQLASYEAKHDKESEEYTLWQAGHLLRVPTDSLAKILGLPVATIAKCQRADGKLPVTAWERFEALELALQTAMEFELLPCEPPKALNILVLCATINRLEGRTAKNKPQLQEG
jgi:hypothetical protein